MLVPKGRTLPLIKQIASMQQAAESNMKYAGLPNSCVRATVYDIEDPEYRGRVRVILCNVGHTNPIAIKHGERFAQLYLTPVYKFNWQVVTELPTTTRGSGGFGSTGKN